MTAETTFFKSPYYEKKSLFMSYASNTKTVISEVLIICR